MDMKNMNISDVELKANETWYYETYKKDEAGLKFAEGVVKKLGLGGLWRGYSASVRIVYTSMQIAHEAKQMDKNRRVMSPETFPVEVQ